MEEIKWIIKEKGSLTKDDFLRLKRGEPVDYIIGFVDFLNCRIDLSYRPLIPRDETEFWTDKALKDIGDKKAFCLDLFAGSGCVGIAVLKNTKNTRVDFAEIDKNLLNQIKFNIEKNGISKDRYNLFVSDIFDKVDKKYDYIFANPPYIPEGRNIPNSVIDFEPEKALLGGEEGLDYIKSFLKDVKKYLKKEGKAYMEFDSSQKEKILEKADFHKDQFGKWRFLTIVN